MANKCELVWDGLSGSFTPKYEDAVGEKYLLTLDSAVYSPFAAYAAAMSAGPNPVPTRGRPYAYAPFSGLYAMRISPRPLEETRTKWSIDVSYSKPNQGEDGSQMGTSPLLRPPTFNIEYIQIEKEIEKAKNQDNLPRGNGDGTERKKDVEGPIVNACGRKPPVSRFAVFQNPILVIKRNFADLVTISTLNEDYQWTTNKDEVVGYEVRRLKYLLTESEGEQWENETKFYPGVTRIEVTKTTEMELENMGYVKWDDTKEEYTHAKDGQHQNVTEPVALKLDGTEGEHEPITWRYLEEVNYKPLVS